MACDMSEVREFLSLESRQKRLLWAYKEVDLDLHPVTGLVLQIWDVEKFHNALDLKSLHPFL